MANVIQMPKLSDTMEEGVIAAWHKAVGDKVESGELLAEIETDKATMEFESFEDGVILHLAIEEGEAAPVNAPIAVIGEKGEDYKAALSAGGASEPTATTEEISAKEIITPVEEAEPSVTKSGGSGSDQRIFASPLAKKIATDKGIDLSQVKGTGDNGRITKSDIESFKPSASSTSTTAVVTGAEGYEDKPISQMRKTIARRLSESKFDAPHFYLTIDLDMDAAVAARKQVNAAGDVKVSFNDIVVKAAALALKKHPKVNSSWLWDKIRTYQHVHVGVAVAVEEGLLVPVIKHADMKGLSSINSEVKELAGKAREKKLQPAQMEGNTFTISNLGMFGIEEFTAIINPPDSCIMAVGGIRQEPVVKDGQIVVGNRMKVTLSCDHRTVDGATGSEFLNTFKSMIENPLMMLV